MNISGIISDLEDASTRLTNIATDVANMVIIDGSTNSTKDMNDKLHDIRNEIASLSRNIEENKKIIQNCCDALGLNVYFSSTASGGGSYTPTMGGSNVNRNVSYQGM